MKSCQEVAENFLMSRHRPCEHGRLNICLDCFAILIRVQRVTAVREFAIAQETSVKEALKKMGIEI